MKFGKQDFNLSETGTGPGQGNAKNAQNTKNCGGSEMHLWHGEKKNVLVCHTEKLKQV